MPITLLPDHPSLSEIEETVSRLLGAAKNDWHWLMATLSLCYGVRDYELIRLKRDDIFWEQKCLRVKGTLKEHERFVPLDDEFLKKVKKYISNINFPTDMLFVTRYGKPFPDNRVIIKLAKRAKIKRVLTRCFFKYAWIVHFAKLKYSVNETVKILKFRSLCEFWQLARDINVHQIFMQQYSDELIPTLNYEFENGVIKKCSLVQTTQN